MNKFQKLINHFPFIGILIFLNLASANSTFAREGEKSRSGGGILNSTEQLEKDALTSFLISNTTWSTEKHLGFEAAGAMVSGTTGAGSGSAGGGGSGSTGGGGSGCEGNAPTFISNNISCIGSNDGAATAQVDSNVIVTYLWSNGDTSKTISSLSAGTYTVTVTDRFNGCPYLNSVTITEPSAINLSITAVYDTSCSVSAQGFLFANASGGTGSFSYLWSTGDTSNIVSGLSSGTYLLTVTDNAGCTASKSVLLKNKAPSDTSFTVTATGNYTWSQTNQTYNSSGVYKDTIQNTAGCDSILTLNLTIQSLPTVSINNGDSITLCEGDSVLLTTSSTNASSFEWRNLDSLRWSEVGNAGISAGTANYQSLAIDPYGIPYVAYQDLTNNGKTTVLKFDSGNWVTVGAAGFSAGSADYQSLAIDPSGTPYVAYRDGANSNQTTVMKFDGSTWVTVGTVGFSSGDSRDHSLAIDASGTPYVAYRQTSIGSKATVMKFDGTAWVTVGNAGFSLNSVFYTSLAINASGVPYVAYRDGVAKKATVMKFNGTAWVTVGNASFSAGESGFHSLAIDSSNIPYVAYQDFGNNQKTSVMKYDGTAWVSVGTAGFSAGKAYLQSLSIAPSGTPYVTYQDAGNSNKATVMKFNGTAWETVGSAGLSNGSTFYHSLAINASGIPYVVYQDQPNNNKTTVMKFDTDPIATSSNIWIKNGETYQVKAINGEFSDSDEIKVEYLKSSSSTESQGACNSYMWRGMTYTQSGIYYDTIPNAAGCDSLLTLNLTIHHDPSFSITSKTNVSCMGVNDGSLTAMLNDSTEVATFLWSNGDTSAMASSLSAGIYSVTVTNANGCTASLTDSITEPSSVLGNTLTSFRNVSCNGGTDGFINFEERGGTSPYKYLWSNGDTTANITGLSAGSYTISVTDANNCGPSTRTITISQPSALSVRIISQNNVTCNGGSNGSATASASGGTAPYTYLWSNAATTASITGVIAGTYNTTITDANGCASISSLTIVEPTTLMATSVVDSNITCNGFSNGGATASATGGTAPYTYTWSNSATTASITGVIAGTYNTTITDANGCTSSSSVTITEPTILMAASIVDSNITCNGFSNGGATASASGGTMPYTYAWSNSATTASITGVIAGSYTVTITDNNGCTSISSSTITEPASLMAASVVDSNITCNGLSNGGATASATGGTIPYTYAWSNSATTASITGVVAGTYTVTITDNNGCTSTSASTITEPTTLMAASVVDSNITCNGFSNGGGTASATGGTMPYTYAWSNATTTASITGVVAGTYTVTITDNNGCTSTSSSTITEPTTLMATSVVDSNITCNGFSNGGATASASGGTAPYIYLWSNAATTASITGVVAGTYTVTITDNNGCTGTSSATITEPASLMATSVVDSNITCNGFSNGRATASASGGTAPYIYLWSNAATTASITGVVSGTYTVTITDANGCTSISSSTITEPASLMAASVVDSNITCNGFSNGGATASVTGGTAPYIYTWNNAATTASITGVVAGTYSVTITDNNACTVTNSATIIVVDTVKPTVITQNINAYLDATGNVSIVPADVDNGSNDICGAPNLSLDMSSFTCVEVGANTVTLTATDVNNNVASATATVTVIDSINPTVITKNATVYLDASGQASISTTDIDNGSTDNCSTVSLALNINNFGCSDVGANTVKLYVTDAYNNVDSATTTVTVIDSIKPTVITKNATVYLDASGQTSISTTDIDNGSTDNCSTVSLALDINNFGCNEVGANAVKLYVTDANNNVDSATASVTVVDSIKPIINGCPANITLTADAGNCNAVVSWVIPIAADNCVVDSLVASHNPGAVFPLGTTTVTYIAYDSELNTDTCSFTVTVTDNEVPIIVGLPNNITIGSDSATCDAVVTWVVPTATDNCSLDSLRSNYNSGDVFPLGTTTVSYTAYDANLNTTNASFTITVIDTTKPVIICSNNIAQCDSIVTFAAPTVSDNCTGLSIIRTDLTGLYSGDIFPVGVTTLVYQVTDGSNNQATCSFDVEVYEPTIANAGPDLITRDIEPIQLQSTATNAVEISWTPFFSLNDAKAEKPLANPHVTTVYKMEVISADGCTDSDEVEVSVTVVEELDVTTLFSPNGDGRNDTWVVNKPDLVKGCQLVIFNRNGTEVYSTNDYQNEWDATINGNLLPEGTYYYVFDCSDGRTMTGPITVLRERR